VNYDGFLFRWIRLPRILGVSLDASLSPWVEEPITRDPHGRDDANLARVAEKLTPLFLDESRPALN
jgi:hypothetical protein